MRKQFVRANPIKLLHNAGWSVQEISQRLMRNADEIQEIIDAKLIDSTKPFTRHSRIVHKKSKAMKRENKTACTHGPTREKQKRWTVARRKLLGKSTDRELARRFGLHFGTVGKMRRALNIPAFCRNPSK